MSPAQCRGCGREISTEDVSCPHCGATQLLSALPSEPPPGASPPSSFRKPLPPPQSPVVEPPRPASLDAEAPSFTLTPMHGLLSLSALLVITILWYGFIGRASSEKPTTSSKPAPVSSPAPSQEAPAAAPAVPQLSAAERQAANEVLEVLQAVQSMTAGDVTPQAYTSRVANAKIQVEKYLQAEEGDRAIKAGVYEAMIVHLLAAAAWRAKIVNRRSEYEEVGAHPALPFCADLRPLLDLPPPAGVERTPAMNRGVNAAENLAQIWLCAANKVAVVEQAIKARSG